MNGEVAQLVSLAAFGNRFLEEGGDPPELFPGHSTFRWVGDVRFAGEEGTAGWFAGLDGARLSLFLPAARPELAVFANATQGAILDGDTAWRAHWLVRDQEAPEHRIWAVDYTPGPGFDVEAAEGDPAQEIAEALTAAEGLAARHAFLSAFAVWFETAQAALDADDPRIEYLPDFVPPGWPLDARRLLTAAASAWVFGGMGSWNDVTFPDDEGMRNEHEEVTQRLYRAVCAAIVAGANA